MNTTIEWQVDIVATGWNKRIGSRRMLVLEKVLILLGASIH